MEVTSVKLKADSSKKFSVKIPIEYISRGPKSFLPSVKLVRSDYTKIGNFVSIHFVDMYSKFKVGAFSVRGAGRGSGGREGARFRHGVAIHDGSRRHDSMEWMRRLYLRLFSQNKNNIQDFQTRFSWWNHSHTNNI